MTKQLLDGRFGSLDLKKIKELSSGAYEAGIYLNNRCVGDVVYDGYGGEPMVYIHDPRDQEEFSKQVQHWTDWMLEHEGVYYEGNNEGMVFEEILKFKENVKFAKSELRKGATIVAVVSQAPKSFEKLEIMGLDVAIGTNIDETPNPSTAAHVLACELVKNGDDLAGEAHDRIVVYACGGKMCELPVVVPIVWDDHRMGLTKESA